MLRALLLVLLVALPALGAPRTFTGARTSPPTAPSAEGGTSTVGEEVALVLDAMLVAPMDDGVWVSYYPAEAAAYYFEYGADPTLGSTVGTAAVPLTANGTARPAPSKLPGASSNTTYYWRLRYKSGIAGGAESLYSHGPLSTFKTLCSVREDCFLRFATTADFHHRAAWHRANCGQPDPDTPLADDELEYRAFSQTIENVKSWNPSFVLDGGDTHMSHFTNSGLTQVCSRYGTSLPDGSTETYDQAHASIRMFWDDIRGLTRDIPLLMINGNHEGEQRFNTQASYICDAGAPPVECMNEWTERARFDLIPDLAGTSLYDNGFNSTASVGERGIFFDFETGFSHFFILDQSKYSAVLDANGDLDDMRRPALPSEWDAAQYVPDDAVNPRFETVNRTADPQVGWLSTAMGNTSSVVPFTLQHRVFGGSSKGGAYARGSCLTTHSRKTSTDRFIGQYRYDAIAAGSCNPLTSIDGRLPHRAGADLSGRVKACDVDADCGGCSGGPGCCGAATVLQEHWSGYPGDDMVGYQDTINSDLQTNYTNLGSVAFGLLAHDHLWADCMVYTGVDGDLTIGDLTATNIRYITLGKGSGRLASWASDDDTQSFYNFDYDSNSQGALSGTPGYFEPVGKLDDRGDLEHGHAQFDLEGRLPIRTIRYRYLTTYVPADPLHATQNNRPGYLGLPQTSGIPIDHTVSVQPSNLYLYDDQVVTTLENLGRTGSAQDMTKAGAGANPTVSTSIIPPGVFAGAGADPRASWQFFDAGSYAGATFNPTTTFTLSLWAQWDGTVANTRLWETVGIYRLRVDGATGTLIWRRAAIDTTLTGCSLVSGEMHHFMVVQEPATLTVYRDGVQCHTSAVAGVSGTGLLGIGGNPSNGNVAFDGFLSEVHFEPRRGMTAAGACYVANCGWNGEMEDRGFVCTLPEGITCEDPIRDDLDPT